MVRDPNCGKKREINDGTYMRGELGAVEVTLRAYVGVSVKSFSDRSATANEEGAFAGGGRWSWSPSAGGGSTA